MNLSKRESDGLGKYQGGKNYLAGVKYMLMELWERTVEDHERDGGIRPQKNLCYRRYK